MVLRFVQGKTVALFGREDGAGGGAAGDDSASTGLFYKLLERLFKAVDDVKSEKEVYQVVVTMVATPDGSVFLRACTSMAVLVCCDWYCSFLHSFQAVVGCSGAMPACPFVVVENK